MDDLISRQAAIDALCAVCGKSCDKSEFVYNAPQDEQVILCPEHYCLCTLPSAQPTVDAVPVIRCKDCKWYEFDEKLHCGLPHGVRLKDDYCSDAERKEE